METMINVTLSDGSEIREKYYVRDDVPRSLINDMAFKEAYAKYNSLQKTIKSLSASFDWMSDDTNETTSKETYTLEQIKKAFWSTFNEAGELWFNNLGSREENEDCTKDVWEVFVEDLYKICPTPRALDVCPSCAGKGNYKIGVFSETCSACHGTGTRQ